MGSFSDRLIQTIMELVSLYLTVELLDPHSLTPQAGRTSFTPGPALYMNDYISDSGYSPRPQLSPITSPYPEPELSPRRLYSSQSSRLMNPYSWCGWIICRSESTRIQRTLSTITPSSSLGASIPATSSLEIPMGYHSQQSFKRKESMKSAAWQNGDIESYRGHIKEMSRDHNGCRALQQSLDNCPEKVVSMIYDEVGNELTDLMMDSFGNYLFQKLLDVSSPEQRREVVCFEKMKLVLA